MTSQSHKYGFVVQFRVNTDNCQTVLDVAQLLGIPTKEVSFGSVVSTVLATCMESWRQSGSVPQPDPFQYGPRMEPYRDGKNGKGKSYVRKAKDQGPHWMRGTIAEQPTAAQAYIPTAEDIAMRDSIWMGERGGLMSPEDALPEGLSSAGIDQYPEDQTEAHEVPSDDALAVRYLALHTRREAGGLTEAEQAEYLRLNHLLFDGK